MIPLRRMSPHCSAPATIAAISSASRHESGSASKRSISVFSRAAPSKRPVDRMDVEGDGFDRKDIGGLVDLEHEVLDLPEQCVGKGEGLDRLLVGVEEAPQHRQVGGEARAHDRQVALLRATG